jgi:hypothetical protein
MTMGKLKLEFFVFKHNINLLEKNGPFFCTKFLKGLVASAKRGGNLIRASKITGIITKESCQKQWRRINISTWKARGSLTA